MRNNLLLSMHGHGKAANRCLGQKRSANLSLSAYMQVGGANETNGQRCFSSPAPAALRPILVRLQPAQLAALDAWIARQDAQLSRPEAIRRLLEQALAVSQPAKSRTQKARSTALDLASTQLDRLLDPSAPDEERQRRKRRLLKGPKEFRDMRDAVRSRSKS
jgi:hypothetical protein